MKITALKATPVNIPLEKPMWWTGGHYPGTSKTIVEVETVFVRRFDFHKSDAQMGRGP